MDEDAGPTAFACHRCGACCTDLLERRRSRGFAELAPGVYRLPSRGGLRLLAWEARAFPDDDLTPLVVLADGRRGATVTLAHELRRDTCPNLDEATMDCTVYEQRPLVCRAFPLLVEDDGDGLAIAASSVCGARVPLDALGEAAEEQGRSREQVLARAYPRASAPALALPELFAWTRSLVAFLAEAGVVEPLADLDADEVDALDAGGLLVDVTEEAGVATEAELRERARQRVEAIRERASAPPSAPA